MLAAYGWADVDVDITPIAGGLINRTFAISSGGGITAVLQCLHPIFAGEVNIDLDIITEYLAAAGMVTPRLVRTADGARWIEHEGRVWRALTYIEGATVHSVPEPAVAHAAGELLGRFHRLLAPLEHSYAFARAGVHDTGAHLGRLRAAIAPGSAAGQPGSGAGEPGSAAGEPYSIAGEPAELAPARELGRAILAAAAALPEPGQLPLRHTHGDAKISNILFEPDLCQARCMLDLDTLGRQTMAYELGDAMRSWCNPQGEDLSAPRVDADIFAAAMTGYMAGSGDLLSPAERAAIVPGWQTVCVELAARFCVDIFNDCYFGWDQSRFSSRRAHNLVRARGQLALAADIAGRYSELARLL